MALEENVHDFVKLLSDNTKSIITLRKTFIRLCHDILSYYKLYTSSTIVSTTLQNKNFFTIMMNMHIKVIVRKNTKRIYLIYYLELQE